MAKYSINRGSAANDGTGDNLRAGADKVNLNFDEIYLAIGDGTTLGANIKIKDDSSTVATINAKGETLGILGGTGMTSTISGSDVTLAVDGTIVTASSTTTLTNKTLTSPHINEIIFEGATADNFETTIGVTDPTQDNTVTLPDISGDVILGKVEGTNFDDSILVGHSTTGTLNAAQDNTGVGIRAIKAITSGDQNTAVGTEAAQSITSSKYNVAVGVNALNNQTTGVSETGYNVAVGRSALQFTTGAWNVGVGGGAGENITSGKGNVIIGKVTADSATADKQLKIAGYDGTTTTTWIKGDSAGKVTIPGDLDVQGTQTTIDSATIEVTNSFTFEGTTSDDNETVLTVIDPTADRTVSIPDATGTIVLKDTTDTLTNKTFDLGGTGNSLTGSLAEFNTALQSESFATLAGTQTLTDTTISNGAISGTTTIDVTSSGNKIRTNFAGTGAFPNATTYEGAFVYDTTGDKPYVLDSGGAVNILTENDSISRHADVNISGVADSYGLIWSSAQGRFNVATIPTAGFSIAMAVAL